MSLLGMLLIKKGYRCYHPSTQCMFITMDVIFHEDSMYFTEPELQGEYLKEISLLYMTLKKIQLKYLTR